MTNEELIKYLLDMIEADHSHLKEAIQRGNKTAAHRCVDSIINLRREIEDLEKKRREANQG